MKVLSYRRDLAAALEAFADQPGAGIFVFEGQEGLEYVVEGPVTQYEAVGMLLAVAHTILHRDAAGD